MFQFHFQGDHVSRIHFFPGMALCDLIQKQHLSHDIISDAFQLIAKKTDEKQSAYQHFKDIRVYSTDEDLQDSQFHAEDIILAGSIGGMLANQFIKTHHLKNPRIVAFESLGLTPFEQVWHFISARGKKYISKNHIELCWKDAGIGHNSYMLHPDKDRLIAKSAGPLKVGKLDAVKGDQKTGYFYLYDKVSFLNNDTGKQKSVNNVLMRCDMAGELIIPENQFDQVSIILDVIVYSAYARTLGNIDLMPDGFSIL